MAEHSQSARHANADRTGANEAASPRRSFPTNDVVERARAFAEEAHRGQQRKYEKTPYIRHLERVAGLLRDHGHEGPAVLAAAFLHDTLEDTDTTVDALIGAFGLEVAELVYWLSDLEKGKRATRKRMSAWRLSRAPLEAKLIKLADLADNTRSIVEHDPSFAPVYLAEKEMILSEMARVEGPRLTDLPLYRLAADTRNAEPPNS